MHSHLDSLSSKQQHQYLNNRVGRYLNIFRPNETDLGNYYFARHPDHLTGLAKTAESLFAIDVDTHLATCYPNNSSVSSHDRLSVRRNMANFSLTRDGTLFIKTSKFVELFPNAPTESGSTYQLSLAELFSLGVPGNLNSKDALFSVTAAGLATWFRNKSIVPNISRQNLRLLMSKGKTSSSGT